MKTESQTPVRLMVITTVDATLGTFFDRQLACLSGPDLGQGTFEVHAVSAPGPGLDKLAVPQTGAGQGSVTVHGVPMERQPHPSKDLVSLWKLYRLMRAIRPQIVHAHTPKAGLLGMMAARAAGVKVRLYTMHGLPLETRQGWWRKALAQFERTTCALATRVYSVSASLEQVVREMRLCASGKISTLGDGTCGGIDIHRFDPDRYAHGAAAEDCVAIRKDRRIPESAPLICFIGRLARDKGIEVLAEAWRELSATHPDAHLLMCGPEDGSDPVAAASLDFLKQHPRVHITGHWVVGSGGMDAIPAIYATSDICVLPTFREGLPQVALEASAMGVPVVGTKVTGVVDAVRDGLTGLLVPARDAVALRTALDRLLQDRDLRLQLGCAAREYVRTRYSSERVNQLWMTEYRKLARQWFSESAESVTATEAGQV